MTAPSAQTRVPLSRDRVLRSAVELADEAGLESVTMRRLAERLGGEAMSLYHHVANKEDLLNGVVDVLVEEIEEALEAGPLSEGSDWAENLRHRILTARSVMFRHRWAPELMESRTTFSPGIVTYFDALLGIMIRGCMTYDLAHHALHALGSRALGFTRELFEPDEPEQGDADAMDMIEEMIDLAPNIVAMVQAISHEDPEDTRGWCDDNTEFEFGLDLILDGLVRLAAAE